MVVHLLVLVLHADAYLGIQCFVGRYDHGGSSFVVLIPLRHTETSQTNENIFL